MSTKDGDVVEGEGVDESSSQVSSYLEMSDEEMLNAEAPGSTLIKKPEVKAAEVIVEAVASEATKDKDDAEDATAADGGTPAEKVVAEAEVKEEKKPAAEVKAEVEVKPVVAEETKVEASAIDYKAEYERLTGTFKANGKEVKVDSVDDAIALMQMGANYNKKMAALKPNLKLMKLLENNGLMTDEKIGFLIDLAKKDPGAINRLVKDSGLDPMDLDAEKASAYKQTAYAVDDREIELDTVLDELQGSPSYTRTLDVVSNKWDVASKQVISQQPQLLKVIGSHIESGIYDQISTEVERERVFGRLSGLSDIEAYRQVGDAIQARGGFNHLAKTQEKKEPAAPVIVQPKPKVEDDKLKDKRRAASSTKTVVSVSAVQDYNPLSMSDEEFSKLATPKFT